MGITKFGTGDILPEEGDNSKTASKEWSAEDEQALKQENEQADKEQ